MTGWNQSKLSPGSFLTVIIIMGMFGPFSTDMYLSALPVMLQEFSTTAEMMNITMYGFMMMMAVSILLMGPITDRYGRRPVLALSLIEFLTVTILCSMAQDIILFIVFRLLQGVGAGGAVTVSTALIKDSYSGSERVRALNIQAMTAIIAPVLAPVLGAGIIAVSGWRVTFAVPAGLAVICMIFMLFIDETVDRDRSGTEGIRKVLGSMAGLCRNRTFLAFMILATSSNMAFMAHISVSSYIYEDIFGLEPGIYTLVLAATLILGTLAMIVINRVFANVLNRRMFFIFPLLLAIGSVLMFTVGDRAWYLFLISFLFAIASSSTARPWGMAVLMGSHDGDGGVVSSLINFAFFLFGCIGMMVSTMPFWPDYITAMAALIAASALIFIAMWVYIALTKGDLRAFHVTLSGKSV